MANPILLSGIASPQSIYEELVVAGDDLSRPLGHHPVGTRGILSDGRVFHYASVGTAALTRGQLMQATALEVGDHAAMTLTNTGAVSAGSTSFNLDFDDVGATDIVAGQYQDGYVGSMTVSTGGVGQYYKIKSHAAVDNSASGTARFNLYDAIETAWTATTDLSLLRHPYDRVVVATAVTDVLVGVPCVTTSASGALGSDVAAAASAIDTSFCWLQTWGPALVEIGAAEAVEGQELQPGLAGIAATYVDAANLSFGQQIDLGTAGDTDGDFIFATLRIAA